MSTEVIVETVYDTIIVDESPPNTILVETSGEVTVLTVAEQGPPGAAGIQNISDAYDVDSTNKTDGSVLVYSAATQQWIATKELSNQIIESGQY
jgi:hypothetical protein